MKDFNVSFMTRLGRVTLSSRELAKKAQGSVVLDCGKTKMLITVCCLATHDTHHDFLPLSVRYQERMYAVGKIPGSYSRREGKSTDREILISRLIDRSVRPLFSSAVQQEIQVVVTLMSHDEEISPETLAILGTTVALKLANLPIHQEVVGTRICYTKDHEYLIDPSITDQKDVLLNVVLVGNSSNIFMLEGQGQEVSEDVLMKAIELGIKNNQQILQELQGFLEQKKNKDFSSQNKDFSSQVIPHIPKDPDTHDALLQIIQTDRDMLGNLRRDLDISSAANILLPMMPGIEKGVVESVLKNLLKNTLIEELLSGKPRIDGRTSREIRPINIQNNYLLSAHGSSLFTRGDTQVLSVTTIGSDNNAQHLEGIVSHTANFMLHYNFPPFSAGEVGLYGAPRRREIGHAELALKSLKPSVERSNYSNVIRVVSEVMCADGSTSMATVCSASLSMLNAGVNITSLVSGVAMGLVKKGNRFCVLTDISEKEDALGDMDCKIAGTKYGINAIQLDLKTSQGIELEIVGAVLAQAREARLEILEYMEKSAFNMPRGINAPTLRVMTIDPLKIKDLIGKKGVVIKQLIEETGVEINVCNDRNVVQLFVKNEDAYLRVVARINEIIGTVNIGDTFDTQIVKILEKGYFVKLKSKNDGYLSKAYGQFELNDPVSVMIEQIDELGRIRVKKILA